MTSTIAGHPCVVRHLSTEESGGFLISFPDLPGCMSDGDTMAEAKRNAADAVNSYIAPRTQHSDPVPEPGSGGPASDNFLARLPKSLHAALIEQARHEGVSTNQYLTALVAAGLGRPAPAHSSPSPRKPRKHQPA
jgi:antitoxin HicB